MPVDERLDILWEYIAACFMDIPNTFLGLLNFVTDHEICVFILLCFLISAAVLILKWIISVVSR